MASSGSYDATFTRDQIIGDALLYISAIGEGETASANAVSEAARFLNALVKLRAADGMPAWALKRGFLLPVTGVSSVNTDSHVVTTYRYTTLSAAAASGASTCVVTSATGISTSDQIGVEQDDGTVHWTTVSSISSTTVTLAAVTTAASGSGSAVYVYTASSDRVQKPIRITQANMLLSSSGSSWDIDVIDRETYYQFGNRTSKSIPNNLFYDLTPSSQTALETNGAIFMYPRFNSGKYVVEFTYQRQFQDFDASTDNPDFPQAFHLPLVIELAALLGPKYGVPKDERQALRVEAKYYLDQALSSVYEEGVLKLTPQDQGR